MGGPSRYRMVLASRGYVQVHKAVNGPQEVTLRHMFLQASASWITVRAPMISMSPNDRPSETGLCHYCKAEFFNTIGRELPE